MQLVFIFSSSSYLHSTLVLLKDIENRRILRHTERFTFYFSSIKAEKAKDVETGQLNLHSTLVLLKFSIYLAFSLSPINLHSTLVLLKLKVV